MKQMENEKFKETVYELLNGFWELDLCTMPNKELVANKFADGSECSRLYDEVYAANVRICQRLGVEEDKDVELIINNLLEMGKQIAEKMYDYGVQFSGK